MSGRPLFDEAGALLGFRGIATDMTAEVSAQARATHLALLAHYDHLTDLPNRVLFGEQLGQALADLLGDDTTIVVLYLDLDGSKSINDTLGHDAGDQMLREAAARLATCVREGDLVAWLGGTPISPSTAPSPRGAASPASSRPRWRSTSR